jgi:hypothetical protein
MRGGNYDWLPPIDEATLQEAFAVASAAHREKNPAIKTILEEQALALWTKAHQARRDAMYARRAPR